MTRKSRRGDICRAAIALAAAGGNHAVTHQGIDVYLEIPRGSTSYYYRSRAELIAAVAQHLAEESRAEFSRTLVNAAEVVEGRESRSSAVIGEYTERLATERREECRARIALLLDPDCGDEQREALATCLFSREAAVELCAARGESDPDRAATALLDGLEGRIARLPLFASGKQAAPGPGRHAEAGRGRARNDVATRRCAAQGDPRARPRWRGCAASGRAQCSCP